jgi:serine protease Do
LVLLKVDLPAGITLAVPDAAPRSSWRVGQWTLVLGRAWNASRPSIGVGILSATNRAWGRAVQTDASVSPANYGGPLIDIQGRVIGVLAPRPAETAGMLAGTELYDSGIGFAVPLVDILRVLPRLQAGETLVPGVMGIGYASRDPFTSAPVVSTCRAGSPAARAGMRVGDRIVEAAGQPVTRVAQLRHALAPLHAGDPLDLVVVRGDSEERVPLRVELVASLPPWRRPVLGVVAVRAPAAPPQGAAEGADGDGAADHGKRKGVGVEWVWPDGPAARAGIQAGDRITAVRERPAAGAVETLPVKATTVPILTGAIGGLEQGATVEVTLERGEATSTVDVVVGDQPTAVPPTVPVSGADPATTTIEKLEAAEIAKPAWAVLPASPAGKPLGVLVYCAPPAGATARGGDADDAARRLAEAWRAAATRYGVAVVLPGPSDPERWGREDVAFLARSLDGLRLRRPIDPTRVAFAGSGAGGSFAWLAGEALGSAVRGVALLDATLPRQATIQPTEPGRSRMVLFGSSPGAAVRRVDDDRLRLEAAGYPVGILPELVGDPIPAETLCAWVESLGVL